ncbi:hypothetical protein CSAL01_00990 [Colletotrichum salicis]|uniref:Heterokaryon incompatibility domain-containing protein n=1 Tax=Colletotrichum salicis TaxID=1209931 RepID=A0A135UNL3_9PEZI|nr:hypothetical protein CSAL01_00990 [Colletotrichum salicis]
MSLLSLSTILRLDHVAVEMMPPAPRHVVVGGELRRRHRPRRVLRSRSYSPLARVRYQSKLKASASQPRNFRPDSLAWKYSCTSRDSYLLRNSRHGAIHIYTQLPQTKLDNHFIRVLDLLPSPSQTDVLEAHLRTVRLEDKPEYECLSYCWGNTTEKHELRVLPNEGHSAEARNLSIGKSLHHALLALRHPTEQKIVWADAVCINQADDIERSNQVAYMGLVYWNAVRLAIWLGDDSKGHAKMVFDAIKPISDGTWNKKARKTLTHADVDNFDIASWNAIADLYANPWFRRVWVQQELGLSRKPFVCWGTAGSIRLLDVFGFDIWLDHKNDAGDRIKDLFIKDATAIKNTRNL